MVILTFNSVSGRREQNGKETKLLSMCIGMRFSEPASNNLAFPEYSGDETATK